jgi:hypothetical protein
MDEELTMQALAREVDTLRGMLRNQMRAPYEGVDFARMATTLHCLKLDHPSRNADPNGPCFCGMREEP